jgi:hypothetical protein
MRREMLDAHLGFRRILQTGRGFDTGRMPLIERTRAVSRIQLVTGQCGAKLSPRITVLHYALFLSVDFGFDVAW